MRQTLANYGIRLLSVLVIFGATACNQGTTQRPPEIAIVNLLSHPILDDSIAGIREGLAESGYTADSLRIVEVSANGEIDKLNSLAREVLSGQPQIIVPVSTPVTQAVFKEAKPTQQIVFSTVTNPADVGMDKRPANMTGVSDAVNYDANLRLIRELIPNATRIGVVHNPGEANSQFGIAELQRLAKGSNVTLRLAPVSRSDQVPDAARALLDQVDVFYIGSDNTVVGALAGLIKVAEEKRIPVIASDSGSVEQGALAAVSVDYKQLGRRVGAMIADLLKSGRSAGQIPNEFFEGESLLLNNKAAQRIGFVFPDAARARAMKVIE